MWSHGFSSRMTGKYAVAVVYISAEGAPHALYRRRRIVFNVRLCCGRGIAAEESPEISSICVLAPTPVGRGDSIGRIAKPRNVEASGRRSAKDLYPARASVAHMYALRAETSCRRPIPLRGDCRLLVSVGFWPAGISAEVFKASGSSSVYSNAAGGLGRFGQVVGGSGFPCTGASELLGVNAGLRARYGLCRGSVSSGRFRYQAAGGHWVAWRVAVCSGCLFLFGLFRVSCFLVSMAVGGTRRWLGVSWFGAARPCGMAWRLYGSAQDMA